MRRHEGGTIALAMGLAVCTLATLHAATQAIETLTLRRHPQSLRLYGARNGDPVIVSSGDGGWINLAPHVAESLAARGYFVIGFDARAYLESFTSGRTTLRAEDEPGDYQALVEFATGARKRKPVLVGVSEGAGLSVLAATDPQTKRKIAGVIALGLPNLNELGWRWKDSLIYLTHGIPNEPIFRTSTVIGRVSPIPLAAIHSTQDEFVPLPEVQKLLELAKDPKKLWVVKASDHRFADNLAEFDRRLIEALRWIRENTPR